MNMFRSEFSGSHGIECEGCFVRVVARCMPIALMTKVASTSTRRHGAATKKTAVFMVRSASSNLFYEIQNVPRKTGPTY